MMSKVSTILFRARFDGWMVGWLDYGWLNGSANPPPFPRTGGPTRPSRFFYSSAFYHLISIRKDDISTGLEKAGKRRVATRYYYYAG